METYGFGSGQDKLTMSCYFNEYNGDIDKSQSHFSLGLKLIGKLNKRFDIGFSTSIESSIYCASYIPKIIGIVGRKQMN